MNTPIAITIAPPIHCPTSPLKIGTNRFANAPKSVKTIVNPAMNRRIGSNGRSVSPSTARSPETNET